MSECGILKWDAPVRCAEGLIYRIRLYSGTSYRATPRSQRKVLSSSTNTLHFTADQVPSQRPLFAIVSIIILRNMALLL